MMVDKYLDLINRENRKSDEDLAEREHDALISMMALLQARDAWLRARYADKQHTSSYVQVHLDLF